MTIAQFVMVFVLVNLLPALAIVFYFTRDSDRVGLIDKLILSVLLSPLVLVLMSFIEEVLGIPQGPATLVFNASAAAAACIFLMGRYFRGLRHYALRIGWARIVAYALFVMLFVFRVLPTHDLLTPILHDPIAHSEWLKYINVNHFTTSQQWYPQGLEYFLNYYATFLDVSYPQVVLTSLNAHMALFPVSMFYLGVLSFRAGKDRPGDRWMIYGFLMFVIAAMLPRPTDFFYIAGKNSMVMVFSVTPLIIHLSTSARNRLDYIITAALVFATVIIHYPTGFLLVFILFFVNLVDMVRIRGGKLAVGREKLGAYAMSLAVLGVFGALLLIQVVPKYLGRPVDDVRAVNMPDPFIAEYGTVRYASEEFVGNGIDVLGKWPMAALAVSLAALLVLPDANRKVPLRLFGSYVVLYLVGFGLLMLPESTYGVFYMAELKHFLPIIIAVTVAWFAYYLLSRTLLRLPLQVLTAAVVIAALTTAFFHVGLDQYHRYDKAARELWTVNQDDLDAFDYIENELPDDALILIQLGSPSDVLAVIAGADGGVWIPSFTDKQVEVSFLEFSTQRSAEIFDLYMAVARNREDEQAIRSLYCDYGIGYVYFGSRPVYFNHMQREMLDTSRYFEKIYDKGATLYRIKSFDCRG